MRRRIFSIGILALGTMIPGAYADLILPTDDGSVGRDWYSNPNFYWVDNTSAGIGVTHAGADRWLTTGVVVFDISSLAGATLAPGSASFDFYSPDGFSVTSLTAREAAGPNVTTGFWSGGGALVGTDPGAGWDSYDVTSILQTGINDNANFMAFIFYDTGNGGGGTLNATESGQGPFLDVQTTPEPASVALFALGLGVLAAIRHRRQRAAG